MSKQTAAQVEALQSQITQLRQEASVHRRPVSEAAKDLMDYCEQHRGNDGLVTGVPDSQNPFQEKKSCLIL